MQISDPTLFILLTLKDEMVKEGNFKENGKREET